MKLNQYPLIPTFIFKWVSADNGYYVKKSVNPIETLFTQGLGMKSLTEKQRRFLEIA
jgi:hypothetical protein